jgi:hypothetical protein
MKLDRFLVISGVPGVHKLVSTRSNGLVIEDRLEGRTRFVPVRQQQISPLASVSIYTETDEGTIPIVDVFQRMLDQLEATPTPDVNGSSAALRAYFSTVLPEHDHDRVHINDIKKCVKWFNFMLEKGIFEEARREAEAEAQADGATAVAEEAPAEETPTVAEADGEGEGPETAHS